ncbi:MAG: hypothetical protein JXB88_00420 [Spirochaetales bacterium]|nr:hypothetical protein [Spirochaetales bacterium]
MDQAYHYVYEIQSCNQYAQQEDRYRQVHIKKSKQISGYPYSVHMKDRYDTVTCPDILMSYTFNSTMNNKGNIITGGVGIFTVLALQLQT